MSNAKRFLSVILAIVMMCSTLVIGANAAYTAYKDSAIEDQYNALDKAVLTTDQYASAALDEVDRMLTKEQLKFTREDIIVGDIDLTSIDAAMDSVYALVNGALFSSLKGMLGDLQNLNVDAFAPESAGGVRRSTSGKTDTDIVYAVLQFLHDNTDLLVSFVNGTIDTGSILSSIIDLTEFLDINKLLKGMLYEFAYGEEGTDEQVAASSVDTMAQDLIDKYVVDGYDEENDDGTIEHVDGIAPGLAGKTNISSGTMYTFLDDILKILYNDILVPIINEDLGETIKKLCGVEYIDNGDGTYTLDYSNLNEYANLLNVDYEVPTYEFTDDTFISQGNNIIKSILDAIVKSDVLVWEEGDKSAFQPNLVKVAKELLVNVGDEFFADYIEMATEEELEAMSDVELVVYAGRAIVNSLAYGMYIPEATTLNEFAFYALEQVLATDVPALDFSSLDPNSTDSLVIMGINYAIDAVSAELDLGLEFVSDMDGVDAQLKKAADYAVDNYGGLLNGITFKDGASGWETIDTVIFSIIPENWLPTSAGGSVKSFIFELVDTIASLELENLFSLFEYRSDSELQKTPKQVIINLVSRVINIIFPGAFKSATTLDALVTNSALAGTVEAIFNALWDYKENLVKAILPTLCGILDLTNDQEFEFPELTWDPTDTNVVENSIRTAGSIALKLKVRNGSTGINTGYTDANGEFHQDSLYTYDIQSVTTNISGITVTYPETIAGGETVDMAFTGSVKASQPFVVTITYDVLTEDGSTLTEEPITETMYSYIVFNASSDEATALTTTATNGFSVIDGPRYLYATSFGDLEDFTITVQNTNSAEATVVPYFNQSVNANANKAFGSTADGTYLQVRTESSTVMAQVDDNAGLANIKVFETTEAYDALSDEKRDTLWDDMIEYNTMYNASTGAVTRYPLQTLQIGATFNGSTTVKNTSVKVFCYNDYGLPGMLESEMGKHRQQSAYAEAESTVYSGSTVWEAYNTAMEEASKAVYSNFLNTAFTTPTGKASLYKPAYENLTKAIEELDAQVLSAGVDSSIELVEKLWPSNAEDLPYYDPSYVHHGVSDYVAYTYYNFRDELRTLESMIDSATIPNEETGEVEVVNELTKAYNEHRFTLYYGRLLEAPAYKSHLEAEIANPTREIGDSSEYSTESWENYQTALTFATATVNSADANPTQVKTAYRELLQAEKILVAPTEGGDDLGDDVTYEFTATVEVLGGAETGALYITGINPDNDLADYFVCNGCSVEIVENEGGSYSTGAVVNVVNDSTGETIATYTVAVYTDISGDGMTDTTEVGQVLVFTAGSSVPTDLDLAAGDVDFDGAIDTSDLSSYLAVAAGSVVVDYEARKIA